MNYVWCWSQPPQFNSLKYTVAEADHLWYQARCRKVRCQPEGLFIPGDARFQS